MSLLSAAASTVQPNLTLIVVASVLVSAGVYLLLERSLTRVLLGIVLMSNGVAVLYLVVSGRAGGAPIVGDRPAEEMSDPLPQAFVLTAIVISLATVAFMMALAYRQWQLTGSDDVPDDAEDAVIQRLARTDGTSSTFDPDASSTTSALEDPDEGYPRDGEVEAETPPDIPAELAKVEGVHPHEQPPSTVDPVRPPRESGLVDDATAAGGTEQREGSA